MSPIYLLDNVDGRNIDKYVRVERSSSLKGWHVFSPYPSPLHCVPVQRKISIKNLMDVYLEKSFFFFVKNLGS